MFVNVRDHEMQKGSLEDSLRALPTCAYIEGGVGCGGRLPPTGHLCFAYVLLLKLIKLIDMPGRFNEAARLRC